MIVGALMVPGDLVDVRPFRTGLIVLAFGLMITLGKDEGGYLGTVLAVALRSLGGTGVAIVGVLTLLAGGLLVTGASAGAMLRNSGRAMHRAARRSLDRRPPAAPPLRVIEGEAPVLKPQGPPVDVVQEFPELVSNGEPPRLLVEEPEPDRDQTTLFETEPRPAADYRLPDRELLRRSAPGAGPDSDHCARVAEALVHTRQLRRRCDRDRPDSGPRVTRYELQLAPDESRRGPEGRPPTRSHHGDPHPGPDPGKQAVGAPEHEPEPRHSRRHSGPAGDLEPVGLARQDISGQAV